MRLPVLMCVGPDDVDRLFVASLCSCVQHLRGVTRIVLVTPDRERVQRLLSDVGPCPIALEILEDKSVLSASLAALPGWCRQQVIKLQAHAIFESPYVVCLSADTVLLQSVSPQHLFEAGSPILYYNRYPSPAPHLAYERCRVSHVARLLGVEPILSWPLGDFVMDLMVFDLNVLRLLQAYLEERYGPDPFVRLLPARAQTLVDKQHFGEWSLYAVFALDVLGLDLPIRNSASRHVAQVHSQTHLSGFDFNARIVHFVDKDFDLDELRARLAEHGVPECFPRA